MTVARRLVLVLLVAGVWSGAGSALLASPAAAGGVDGDTGVLSAAVYNATPYTWTLVAAGAPNTGRGDCNGSSCWNTYPAATIPPGGGGLYRINSYDFEGGGICFGNFKASFDAWMTYRVNVVGGPPEYVTVMILGSYAHGICFGRPNDNDDGYPGFGVADSTGPPPSGWDVSQGTPPGAQTPNPQLTYSHNVPYLFDQTVAATGNFTIDASTPQGQPFVDLLNSLCSGQDGTTCSFTQTTPITYGPGDLAGKQSAQNCDLSAAAARGQPSTRAAQAPPPPADNDPNYYLVEYAAAQSATLSVGAGVTVSAEFELFDTIASEASVSVEAEHEWEEVKTFTRETKVFIPSNSWGFLWVAPTVGRVTGTIVATIGSATFTANNFTEVRSGVTGVTDPLKQPTPAFNTVTKTRPMTAAERTKFCGASASSRASASSQLRALKTKPPARLVPHRSVARVALGETQEAVVARLGWPTEKRFALNPCKGLPGCAAVRGLGGTWNYKKRKLSVVFGPDRRVAALIHSGSQRTVDGVGKDSTLAAVRGAFPGIACARSSGKVDCTIKRVSKQDTVKTVFRFTERRGGRWKCARVLIYTMADRRGQVTP
jgi:hypothetical protein